MTKPNGIHEDSRRIPDGNESDSNSLARAGVRAYSTSRHGTPRKTIHTSLPTARAVNDG